MCGHLFMENDTDIVEKKKQLNAFPILYCTCLLLPNIKTESILL